MHYPFSTVAGLREWFSQTDECHVPRIPVMANMKSDSVSSKKYQELNLSVQHNQSLNQINSANRNSLMVDEYSDEDEEYQIAEPEQEVVFFFYFPIAERTYLNLKFLQIAG